MNQSYSTRSDFSRSKPKNLAEAIMAFGVALRELQKDSQELYEMSYQSFNPFISVAISSPCPNCKKPVCGSGVLKNEEKYHKSCLYDFDI